MRNHYARNRNHHSRLSISFQSVAASRLRLGLEPRFRSLASRGCSKWRSTLFVMRGATASTCSGSSSDYQNKCLNQIIRMLMLRYPVFLGAGNLIREPQASSSLFRRLTNMRRIGISNTKEQDEQVKIEGDTKRSIFVQFIITCWPNSQCLPRQGRRVGARVALSRAICSNRHVSISA